jgi:dethiobiotin synthetase
MEEKGAFLIGTDRDVGKTIVGAALVALLNERGRKAVLMTPIETGGSVESAADLLDVIGVPDVDRRLINPIQFETLASPYVAGQVEDRPVDPKVLLDAFNELVEQGYFVVVEGGGAMVPIRSDYFMLDLLTDMALPSIVVARTSRGTLNHTLLTTRAMATAGHVPIGFILNGFGRFGEGFAESMNADTLAELEPEIPVLANIEWRPAFSEDIRQFIREVAKQPGIESLLERWT